jgi:hypothetical protein
MRARFRSQGLVAGHDARGLAAHEGKMVWHQAQMKRIIEIEDDARIAFKKQLRADRQLAVDEDDVVTACPATGAQHRRSTQQVGRNLGRPAQRFIPDWGLPIERGSEGPMRRGPSGGVKIWQQLHHAKAAGGVERAMTDR